ncbi:hypothetical protein [Pseudomonas sp. NPDC090208]|uniref:hypothetical protein n=1 Tax=Pseudomonas sp. NPDC090208 TaxID=3364478 RepID=UPI003800BC36
MRYLKYTNVDSVTKISVSNAPASNGPVDPAVAGLEYGFVLESLFPTSIPFYYGTCPDDSEIDVPGVIEEVTEAQYNSAREQEAQDMAAKALAGIKSVFEQAVQNKLDFAAQAAGYDSIATAVSYAEEPAVAKFQNDGKALRAWRSLVWQYVYQQLDAVLSGQRDQPLIKELLDELPVLTMPEAA